MYITKNHIAFYSNVFGYVTKVLIPIQSVIRISKEKTVKIIPNAIAVATIDERHVFASFLSREAAYQLMIRTWKEALPMREFDLTMSSAQVRICSANENNPVIISNGNGNVNIVPSSIQSIRRNSSTIINGNDGMLQLITDAAIIAGKITDKISPNNDGTGHIADSNPSKYVSSRNLESNVSKGSMKNTDSITSTQTAFCRSKSINKLVSKFGFLKLNIPQKIHITYFGLSLAIILALIAIFLSYRISEIQSTRVKPLVIDDSTDVSEKFFFV